MRPYHIHINAAPYSENVYHHVISNNCKTYTLTMCQAVSFATFELSSSLTATLSLKKITFVDITKLFS